MDVSGKLFRNTIFAASCYLFVAILNFLIMPFTMRILGKPIFGAWQIFLTIFSYSAFLDFGISSAVAKYVAEYNARNQPESVNRIANTGFVVYLVISLIGTIILLSIADWFLIWILTPRFGTASGVDYTILHQLRFGYYWVVAITFLMVVAKAFRMVLIGMQKLYVINMIETGVQVPFLILLIYVLYNGLGFRGFVILQFFQYTLINVLLVVCCLKITPGFKINPFAASSDWLRRMYAFGWKTSLPGVSTVLQSQTERLALARYCGLEFVALWSFGAKLVDVVRLSITPAVNMVMPAASELSVNESGQSLKTLRRLGTKFLIVLIFPLGWLIFAIAPLFIAAWMGVGYGASILALRFLIIAAIHHLAFSVAANVARGKGNTTQDLVSSIVLVVVELSLVLTLGRHFGYKGILITTLIAYTLSSVTSFYIIYTRERLPIMSVFMKQYLVPYVIAVVAASPIIWFNHIRKYDIMHDASISHRVVSLGAQALVQSLLFMLLYGLLLFVSGYIKRDEIRTLRQAMAAAGLRHRAPAV